MAQEMPMPGLGGPPNYHKNTMRGEYIFLNVCKFTDSFLLLKFFDFHLHRQKSHLCEQNQVAQ